MRTVGVDAKVEHGAEAHVWKRRRRPAVNARAAAEVHVARRRQGPPVALPHVVAAQALAERQRHLHVLHLALQPPVAVPPFKRLLGELVHVPQEAAVLRLR